jgi:prepilin peptidase CpaA
LQLFGRINHVMLYLTLLTAICIGLLVLAAAHDLAARTIPNVLPAVLIGGGLALHLGTADLIRALAAAAVVGALVGFCWLRGWMGGGDLKLATATALVVPVGTAAAFVLDVATIGGMLALGYLIARRLVPAARAAVPASLSGRLWRAECWRIRRGGPLPYGVAIAGGGVLALLQGAPT